MAFGNASKPSRIYSYGALAPDLEGEVVRQMRLAARYRNALVELELARRQRALDALRARFPEVPALEAEWRALDDQLAEGRKAARRQNALERKRRLSKAESRALQEVRARRRDVYARLRARKVEAWADPALREDLAAVKEWAAAEQRRLRGLFSGPQADGPGLFWGSYLPVEASMQSARCGAPPAFRGFSGEGKVCVQLQKGLSVPDLLACEDQRLRLEAVDEGKRHYLLWLRVGSKGRAPVWAKAPVVLHRDPPANARVKWAHLLRRRCGTHWRWQAQLVLEREAWPAAAPPGGACGIDLGWRLLAHTDDGAPCAHCGLPAGEDRAPACGLRVAYWASGDGESGELVIAHQGLRRWHKSDELASIRDRDFNEARAALAAWLRSEAAAPEWLRNTLSHLHAWRSPARLAALLWRWHGVRCEQGRQTPWRPPAGLRGPPGCGRFLGDEKIFDRLWAWRKRDKHLADWQANNLRKAVAWRDDLYRNFAKTLAGKYRVLVFEDTDWRELQEVPEVEEGGAELRTTNHRIAAVGRLRQLLREKAAEVVLADPAYTTRRCHACGWLQEDFDQARDLEHACENSECGRAWDQDYNAAVNLLAAASDEVVGQTPGAPRVPKGLAGQARA